MKKENRRYWIPAVMILLVMAVVFGGAAGRKISAKSQLTSALSHVFSQLEERFRDDPLLIIAECYDPEGKYTVDLEAVTNQDMLGTITYNMTVGTDLKAHRFHGEGIAHTGKQDIDLSFYLDSDFMAASSDELVAGEYYGITYDTFSSDLRKIPLLDLIINDTLLVRWDNSVQKIQEQVCHEYSLPQIPEFNQGEMRKLLLGIAAMPCELRKVNISIGETVLSCTELDYIINMDQVAWLLSRLTGDADENNGTAHFSFFLYEDALVRFRFSGMAGETPFQYCFDLSLDPLNDPLTITGSNDANQSMSVTVSTQRSENQYAENWDIHTVAEGEERDRSFSFDWSPQSGALNFRSGKLPVPVALNLQKAQSGVRLETEDLLSLIRMMLQEEIVSPSDVSAVMTVSRGSAIEAPAYKNLDQWSMQDFLTMLAGAGSLVGIRLE